MPDRNERGFSRREVLKAGVVALGLPTLASLFAGSVSGCGSGEQAPAPRAPGSAAPPAPKPAEAKPEAPAPPPSPAAGSGGDLVTEIPAMAALVSGLQYLSKSEKPDQSCRNCQFFTAEEGGRGKCQLFSEGRVEAVGWCASWAKRVATT
jgi:hypothetical protein